MFQFLYKRIHILKSDELFYLIGAGLLLLVIILATIAFLAPSTGAFLMEGSIEVYHSDILANNSGAISYADQNYFYYLDGTDGHLYPLIFTGARPSLISGSKVAVKGTRRGDVITVPSAADVTTEFNAQPGGKPRKTAIVAFNFSNGSTLPFANSQLKSWVFGPQGSVSAFLKEASFGQTYLLGNQDPGGDVFGPVTIAYKKNDCSWRTWAASADLQVSQPQISLLGYDNIIYVFPHASQCPFSTLSEVGGGRTWINGPLENVAPKEFAHALGENLGILDSNALNCIDEKKVRVSISDNCTVINYGDPFDTMGGVTNAVNHFNNFYKGRMSYLASGNIVTTTRSTVVGGTVDYILTPIEQSSSGVQVIRVVRDTNSAGVPLSYYYLETRKVFGYDNFAVNSPAVNGISIRLAKDFTSAEEPALIDATPETATFDDAPLLPGKSFTDAKVGVTITFVSQSAAGVVARITYTNSPSAPAPEPTPTPAPTPSPAPAPKPAPKPAPGPDTTSPSAPTNLSQSSKSLSTIGLTWTPSSDNVRVAGYRIYRGGTLIGNSGVNAFTDTGLTPDTAYNYYVVAFDGAGNTSPVSNTLTARTDKDTTSPSAPSSLVITNNTNPTMDIAWGVSSDNVGVVGYRIYRSSNDNDSDEFVAPALLATTTSLSYHDTGLQNDHYYTYYITAIDAAGNESAHSNSVTGYSHH